MNAFEKTVANVSKIVECASAKIDAFVSTNTPKMDVGVIRMTETVMEETGFRQAFVYSIIQEFIDHHTEVEVRMGPTGGIYRKDAPRKVKEEPKRKRGPRKAREMKIGKSLQTTDVVETQTSDTQTFETESDSTEDSFDFPDGDTELLEVG